MSGTVFSQDLIFTVLPFGMSASGGDTYLDFSLVVSPRLDASPGNNTTLGNYPDWAAVSPTGGRAWPATVAAFVPTLKLHLAGLPGAPSYPATLLSKPKALAFADVFGPNTPVTPYVFPAPSFDGIRSAPVASMVASLQSLYGRFGFTSGAGFPSYAEIVGADAFGPMGFQQTPGRGALGITDAPGQQRQDDLLTALDHARHTLGAVPKDLTNIAAATGYPEAATSMTFLQYKQFLQRDLPLTSGPTSGQPFQGFDFHQMIGALGSLPSILRLLGIVLDMKAGPVPASVVSQWETSAGIKGGVYVSLDTSLFLVKTNMVGDVPASPTPVKRGPATQALLAKGTFRPLPLHPTATDHTDRMLKMGDPSLYSVVSVDHDSAAMKTMQFANNVTRSRKGATKHTLTTPDHYALPALRTGGFAIARSGRATQMYATIQRQVDTLQAGLFGGGSTPVFHEDDLIRGYRFDVLDVADGVWRSLMWRQGTVTINGVTVHVTEEDTVVPAPAKQGPTNALYLQETLSRWDGWSLAVPRPGTPFGMDTIPKSEGFNVETVWQVPGSTPDAVAETTTDNAHRLPRLRYGRTYQFRARAADLAGNALLVKYAPHTGVVVTPPIRYLRYEPVPAPRALMLQSELMPIDRTTGIDEDTKIVRPGDSEEIVVIRSESATVNEKTKLDNGVATRLLVPARTSVMMAEHHGAFDLASTTGKPMNSTTYADIAARDGTTIDDDGKRLAEIRAALGNDVDAAATVGTSNPYLFPDQLAVNWLPEVLGRTALVRGLPVNSFKETTAPLPFDTAKKGWPALQAVRVKLSRGTSDNWATNLVPAPEGDTTELDLTLAKGVMFTALVNCQINATARDLMALWEWIKEYAAAHNKSAAEVGKLITDGEHWMFTPWRRLTFVHAVRTPLKRPQLLIRPVKTAIGQTYAAFDGTKADPAAGTVLISRRSTARVDVDATWSMHVDTGSNANPDQPVAFSGHAFGVDLTRDGFGYIPGTGDVPPRIPDAANLAVRHQFNDTKHRAVTYKATATSFYTEYFRLSFDLPLGADPIHDLRTAVHPGVAFEGSTVELTLRWTENGQQRTRKLVPAPAGTDPAAPKPTPGDYVVVEDPDLNGPNPDSATHGTVQVLANATVSSTGLAGAVVEFSYVGPTIHTFSDATVDKTVNLNVPNSARPSAPDLLYVVPIYKRTSRSGSVTRTGGALRLYLNRPWWSSGDNEQLGVVCWHQKTAATGVLPPDALSPYVTQWGFDPVFKSSTSLPAQPTPDCFPLATRRSSTAALSIEESTTHVDVAGHDVHFDSTRNLWYCDVQIRGPKGGELAPYTTFVRLALARYQPFSITGAHLSRVILADFAQLAPDRHVTVTGSGSTRTVTVAGRAPRGTKAPPGGTNPAPSSNKILVYVEEEDARISDQALAWQPVTATLAFPNPVTLTAAASGSSDEVTWRGTVHLPAVRSRLRLAFEEYEMITGGDDKGRLAYTETITL